jgi:uncharacterized protein YlaI
MTVTCLLCGRKHAVEKWEAAYAASREPQPEHPAYVCPSCTARVNRDARQVAPLPQGSGPR